jgi:predicted nuclease of predicted toxin-antitoxin system
MKLLLDEHLSPRIAEALRARGCDAVSVLETDLEGKDDRPLWERAITEERVVVTYDKDDFPGLFTDLFQEGIRHPGLVIISSRTIRSHDIGGLMRALERLIESGVDLSDQSIFLRRARSGKGGVRDTRAPHPPWRHPK